MGGRRIVKKKTMSLAQRKEIFRMTTSNGPAIAEMQAQIAQLQEQIRTHEVAIAELREKETELQTIVSTLQEMEKFMRESGVRRG